MDLYKTPPSAPGVTYFYDAREPKTIYGAKIRRMSNISIKKDYETLGSRVYKTPQIGIKCFLKLCILVLIKIINFVQRIQLSLLTIDIDSS